MLWSFTLLLIFSYYQLGFITGKVCSWIWVELWSLVIINQNLKFFKNINSVNSTFFLFTDICKLEYMSSFILKKNSLQTKQLTLLTIETPIGLIVTESPTSLQFTKNSERLSYHIIFTPTVSVFFKINVGVRASLRAPRLIPRTLKLTTM